VLRLRRCPSSDTGWSRFIGYQLAEPRGLQGGYSGSPTDVPELENFDSLNGGHLRAARASDSSGVIPAFPRNNHSILSCSILHHLHILGSTLHLNRWMARSVRSRPVFVVNTSWIVDVNDGLAPKSMAILLPFSISVSIRAWPLARCLLGHPLEHTAPEHGTQRIQRPAKRGTHAKTPTGKPQ